MSTIRIIFASLVVGPLIGLLMMLLPSARPADAVLITLLGFGLIGLAAHWLMEDGRQAQAVVKAIEAIPPHPFHESVQRLNTARSRAASRSYIFDPNK